MKDKRNIHLKIQELCDCYATNDPLREMSTISSEMNSEDAALKWLALAALHGINAGAKTISLTRTQDGMASVTAMYREHKLPSPGNAVGKGVISALRELTHINDRTGQLELALGVRDSQANLEVKIESDIDKERIIIDFKE